MKNLLLILICSSFINWGSPMDMDTITLPNSFNGIPFAIENVVNIQSLDSSLIISCIIKKELILIDLISKSENLVKIYGHGSIELDQYMQVIQSRYHLFNIKYWPDRFILVTTHDDPVPNTIIADYRSVVNGKEHMDSVMSKSNNHFFDHYKNSLIYKNNRISGFVRSKFNVLKSEIPEENGNPYHYEEDIMFEPIIDYNQSTKKVYWEKHFDPIAFIDGKVVGSHQLINKESKLEKYSQHFNQELAVFDIDGQVVHSQDLYWEKPMQAITNVKVYETHGLSSFYYPAQSAAYIYNEIPLDEINDTYEKNNYHIVGIDKYGNETISIPFKSDHLSTYKSGLIASVENGNTLLSAIKLKQIGSNFELLANLHWFDHNSLIRNVETHLPIKVEPSFKHQPIFQVRHISSFELGQDFHSVVYTMEETTEQHLKDPKEKDYFKTWYAFLVYDHQFDVVDFEVTEPLILADEPSEIAKISGKNGDLTFSVVRPNYFTNASNMDVMGKDLLFVKINQRTGQIQKLATEFKLSL